MADQTPGTTPIPPKLNLAKRIGIPPPPPQPVQGPSTTPAVPAASPIPAPVATAQPVVAAGASPIANTPTPSLSVATTPRIQLKPAPAMSTPAPAATAPKPEPPASSPSTEPKVDQPRVTTIHPGNIKPAAPVPTSINLKLSTPAARPAPVPPIKLNPPESGAKPGGMPAAPVVTEPPSDSPRTIKIQRPAGLTAPGMKEPASPPAPASSEAHTVMKVRVDAARTMPPAGPAPAQAPAAPALTSKRETSKIPLEMAKAMHSSTPTGASAPKTIRIKPPSALPGPASAPSAAAMASAEKRKTSRISLESALNSDTKESASTGAPETIKLKRPSEASTVKVVGAPALGTDDDAKSKTARLDDIPGATEEDASPTRRKTIKVKRAPSPSVVGAPSAGAEPEVAGMPSTPSGIPLPAFARPPEPEPPSDELGWPFALVAVITLIVSFLTVYVISAQCFGPNDVCRTQLSYGAEGMRLEWPGRIAPPRK